MRNRSRSLLLLLAFCLPAAAERVKLTVLATTDLHGNLYPVDYYNDRPANRGLAKIATLIQAERAAHPNHLLVDCGDTIQGTPLEYVYQMYTRTGQLPLKLDFKGEPFRGDPMMLAMNHLRYDAMTVGNHEFNFGLRNLEKARSEARFPWLSANTIGGPKPFQKHLVKTVAGVKVAIIGLTTPAVPVWEKPEHFSGYRFEIATVAVEKALAELRPQKPDLVIVAAHMGLGRDPRSGRKTIDDAPNENQIYDLALTVPGVDAIVFGHTHQELSELMVNGVLLAQPKNWGFSLAALDFELESRPGGGFSVVKKSGRTIQSRNGIAPDPEILRIARPYHEMTERYLNTVVADAGADLDGRTGRVEDSALVDAIHQAQLFYTRADVSFTALFNPRIRFPKGPVTARQIASLYIYENELYAIEGTGRMVKDALENAARFFLSCSGDNCATAPLINQRIIGFNYDMAEGVTYEIDLTQPAGHRIRNLKWKGRPLPPEQKLRIAINSYRAGGSGGYGMFRNAKVVWRSQGDLRDLIVSYYTGGAKIPARPNGNWRVTPPEAARNLVKQALGDRTPVTQ
jgi:2',3'-cyclic-nucleotide 2'-phosphodiesterase (5'-nucleotidase family)